MRATADRSSPARSHDPLDSDLPLVTCIDCDEQTFRRRHPVLGIPVRCSTCEEREADRLRGLAGGRRALSPEGLAAFERLKADTPAQAALPGLDSAASPPPSAVRSRPPSAPAGVEAQGCAGPLSPSAGSGRPVIPCGVRFGGAANSAPLHGAGDAPPAGRSRTSTGRREGVA